jgi:hypothetical protein
MHVLPKSQGFWIGSIKFGLHDLASCQKHHDYKKKYQPTCHVTKFSYIFLWMVDIVAITHQKKRKPHVPHSLDLFKLYPNVLRVKAHKGAGRGGGIVAILYIF